MCRTLVLNYVCISNFISNRGSTEEIFMDAFRDSMLQLITQTSTNLPPDVRNTGFTSQQLLSDYYVQNASFLRCENVSLGYNAGKVFGATTLRITANVQNAFLVTKYKGVDPEIFNGIDNNFYPRARTFTLGIALGI